MFLQTRDSAVVAMLFIITTPTCSRSSSFLALLLMFPQPHSSADATMIFIVVTFIVVIASYSFHAVTKVFAMFH